ncbi:MAG: HAMP domain-containing histidine kinase [Alicyclobacillus herbarius]|uniref:sensor histidine kinase n=1 Tax=Alicyclobacillus herbarius TaxID=122960 RepID=UPI002356C166|nr:HAMP domain-containing sensor histidine kinase [Alicyclobacillus herbarius]MCL6631111.1 HAMP domain-containing histidine kinase [Alicyclobacillus herbarius]
MKPSDTPLTFTGQRIFRRMYLQIVTILTGSMLTILLLVGSIVYIELKVQMAKDAEGDLQTDLTELQALITSLSPTSEKSVPVRSDLADDRGQHLYFAVFKRGSLRIESYHPPIPSARLRSVIPAEEDELAYRVIEYHREPYRLVATAWHYHGQVYKLYLYQSIANERQVLRHALRLIILSGSLGAILACLFYLWLSRLVLRPARESWQAQQRMIVELSHELQTPLATMNALAAGQVRDLDVRRRLMREIHRASDLVSDILYLSRLEGMPRQEPEPVAVSDLTEEVADQIGWLAHRQGINLTGSAVQGLYVLAVPDEWRRLISTLLKNVVDHARPGSRATWRLAPEEGEVVFRVENESQALGSVADTGGTHGFGLHIVRRLAKTMGGEFRIEVDQHLVRAEVRVPHLRQDK